MDSSLFYMGDHAQNSEKPDLNVNHICIYS